MVLTRKGTKKAKLTESKYFKEEAGTSTVKSENLEKPDTKPEKLTNITNLKRETAKQKTEINIKNETKPRNEDYKKSKPRITPASRFGTINPIWRTHFENIRKMRSKFDAPVDTDGCDKLHDEQDTPKNQRFQILLSLLFSSQTKDPINAACLARFKKAEMANVEACQEASEVTLAEMIRGVSFHKTKAKNLKKISDILVEHFDSDIPRDIEGLVGLPGIGYKMGHLIMAAAWGEITGLAVDVHVHRTVNRLKWFKKTIEKPNDMMDALMAEIPKEHWRDINLLIVGFGQQICFSRSPKCGECLNREICDFK